MTDPARRALRVDAILSGVAIAGGALAGGIPRDPASVLIALVGATVFVGAIALAEQTNVLAVVDETRPASLVLTSVAFLAVGAALVIGRTVVASPAATLLWGMGIGLGVYRFEFGLRRPVPEKRREQATLWGSPPKLGETPDGNDTEER